MKRKMKFILSLPLHLIDFPAANSASPQSGVRLTRYNLKYLVELLSPQLRKWSDHIITIVLNKILLK